jgi:hypothetical protein
MAGRPYSTHGQFEPYFQRFFRLLTGTPLDYVRSTAVPALRDSNNLPSWWRHVRLCSGPGMRALKL